MSGKRLNPFQHALQRPDTYIGSIKTVNLETYILDGEGNVQIKKVKWNAGLFNIIREIGSNCIDNKWRSIADGYDMKSIRVEWDSSTQTLSFWNDGKHIPVEKQTYSYEDYRKGNVIKEVMYPAEVFFGEMLAGTNFEDDEERKTSGRNGMGSKCTNVFSTRFEVEHTDPDAGKKFLQVYTDNAKERSDPKVTSFKAKNGWTKITFSPDFDRFGYDIAQHNDDFVGLLGMYILEIAAMTALPVHLIIDGESKKYHLKTFDKYARMFYPDTKTHKMDSIKLPNGDECVVVESHIDIRMDIPDMLEDTRHLAFVNGLKTKDGGVHVDAWRDAIFPSFVRTYNSRNVRGAQLVKTSAKEVYPYLTMFIRTEMDKPSFDTQTKDRLNGPEYNIFPEGKTKAIREARDEIKSKIDNAVKKMMKWNFVSLLEEKLTAKSDRGKPKKSGRRVNLGSKAQEANLAGKKPEKCTLYITEGLSAKTMAISGISSLTKGQDFNGAFAVQGKFINVANASSNEIASNEESNMLKEMLNLRLGVDYSKDENWKTLRYHKVMLMTDADDDGIHIRGLLINYFYTLWPQLYERNFVGSFSTAVAKVSLQGKKESMLFYSNPEYKQWYEETGHKLKISEVKYLKGLGSIHPDDVSGYFSNPKAVRYFAEGDEDQYMDLGFNDEKSDWRKEWLLRDMKPAVNTDEDSEDDFEEPEFVYDGDLGISTFVDNQLVIYHRMALRRALPNYMDGFKESQRKAFYAIRYRNYKKTMDLEKVMGAVKEITGYHHGGASLLGTIRNMAVSYPGSNNIALLQSDGGFGSRLEGGKDAAAARYIATALEDIAKLIFPSDDDVLLENVFEDNEKAEYKFFVPVICMLLVNGSDGIASGFSTNIPNYNPEDIVRWTRAWLDGTHRDEPKLVPWYRGITGPITLEKSTKSSKKFDRWRSKGVLFECEPGCGTNVGGVKCKGEKGWWHITDLPVGKWTQSMKEHLEYLMSCSPPKGKNWKKLENKCITDFREYNTNDLVHFMIKPTKSRDGNDWEPDMDDTLKCMQATKTLKNMVAIDENNYPTRFSKPEDILKVWCPRRLTYYDRRRDYLLKLAHHNLDRALNRYKYVKAVGVDKTLDMHQDDDALEKAMLKMGLQKMSSSVVPERDSTTGGDDNSSSSSSVSFDYLLSMQMRSMTVKKLAELKKEADIMRQKIKDLEGTTGADLWRADLDSFEIGYKKYLQSRQFATKPMDKTKQRKRR